MPQSSIRIGMMAAPVLAAAFSATVLHAEDLPDAPRPQQAATAQTHTAVPATRPNTPAGVAARKWSDVVNPGETVPTWTNRDKLIFPVHEQLQWTALAPLLFDVEYGMLTNDDPKYGTNGEAWGKRLGAAALRQGSTAFFTDGLLPIVFHQDPRYYRQAYGSYRSRTYHALQRIYISQADSGHREFNYSGILGRGMGSALTQAYYPDRSRGAEIVLSSWGVSLAALGGENMFQEFWPDLRHKLFHSSGQ